LVDDSLYGSNLELERKVGAIPLGKAKAVLVVTDYRVMKPNGLPKLSDARLLPFRCEGKPGKLSED